MNKLERRRFFEDLCRLRALYRLRSEYDATPVMSIDAVEEYAIGLLDQPGLIAPRIGHSAEGSASDSNASR